MASKSFHNLPPHKRFKLTQQQKENIDPNHKYPLSTENCITPSRLPAKKRKESPPNFTITTTTYCLPAKKRIWAPQPFDLNLEYEQEIPPIKSPVIDIHNDKSEEEFSKIIDEENLVNEEDGIVCAVCESTDGDPTDPIVLCDGCDLMVHAMCYGHPLTNGIPQDDWFCAQCLASKESQTEISCCLCPVQGGALKSTTGGKWAHLVCAIYVPEVFFNDPEGREGIDCSKILKKRWEKKCYVCKAKNNGCVIDCSEPNCPLAFHVSCGLKEELCIEYRQGKKNKGGVVAAFCSTHTHLWKKQERTGKFKIVARDG